MKAKLIPIMLLLAGAANAQAPDAERARAAAEADRARAAEMRAAGESSRVRAEEARAAAEADRARARARRHSAPTEQEQLAIAALEGLLSAPPERSLPLVRRVLAGSQTELVKMRALFVLSQIDSDEAQKLLLQQARADDGDLRLEAIRMIGIGGNDKALAALADLYRGGDGSVRQEVLNAYLIAGRKQDVLQLARSAKDEDEARAAIQALGAMGALAELRQLGDLGQHSGALVQAYAIAGDLDSLLKLAQNASDEDARIEATRSMGIVSDKAAGAALRQIYQSDSSPKVRQAALDGLMMRGDEVALLEIYRASSNTEEKTRILRQLTMIGGDAALEAIDAALQGKAP